MRSTGISAVESESACSLMTSDAAVIMLMGIEPVKKGRFRVPVKLRIQSNDVLCQ